MNSDGGAEFSIDPSREVSARLDGKYKRLGESITLIDRKMYGETDETVVTTTLGRIKNAFTTHFSKPSQELQVAEAASNYFHRLATSIDTEEGIYDDNLANFLSSFPDNILTSLGENASPNIVTRVLQIGSDAIDIHMGEIEDKRVKGRLSKRSNIINGPLGFISTFLTSELLQTINNAGERQEDLLQKIEEVARSRPFIQVGDLVRFYERGIYTPSEKTNKKIAKLREHILHIDPHIDTTSSPFNSSDREPWKERGMGVENRPPSWKDLAEMIISSEEDDIEYGFLISRDPDDGNLRNYYKAGKWGYVYNGGEEHKRIDKVFFHAHPSHTSINSSGRSEQFAEVVAPLISPSFNASGRNGDLTADDAGGGYFNVATIEGLTFQVGMERYNTLPEKITASGPHSEVYVIENGAGNDNWFEAGIHGQDERIVEIMQRVKDTGEPFVYSIYQPHEDTHENTRRYFVHIPWDKIDGDISLEQVLYGTGLRDLVGRMDNLPQIPVAPNVKEALALAA